MSEDNVILGARWEQLVEALRYKPEERGFDSRWYCNFYWRNHYGLTMALGSNEPPGGKGGWCLRLKNLQLSYADFLEIW
jgi:hypothetical protein